ncbi:MAG: hypothetical protein ACERKT_05460 [Acidobacteriota bacterium]
MNSTVETGKYRPSVKRMAISFGAAAALAIGLTGLSAGQAAADQIKGGDTALKLNSGVAKALTANGVAVSPVKPAKVKKGAVVFPVTGGKINPKTAASTIRHSGGLRFQAGGKSLVAKSFTVKTGKSNKLSAKVGKSRVNLLNLNLSKAKVKQNGNRIRIGRVGVSLTGAAANALNQTFGVHLFQSNMRIGRVGVDIRTKSQPAKPKTVQLQEKGSTDLALDPGTAQALTDLGVAAAPVGPASVTPGGEIAFPITGGKVNASTFAGTIRHSGGLSLTAGDTTVELTRFRINIDNDPDLTALVGGQRVSILSLDLSDLKAKTKGKKITLSGVSASLTADAAAALNGAFGVTAFTEGLTLGTATVNAFAK